MSDVFGRYSGLAILTLVSVAGTKDVWRICSCESAALCVRNFDFGEAVSAVSFAIAGAQLATFCCR